MSFTTGGLFQRESVKLAVLFLAFKDWNAVRDKVLSENSLQARTLSTSKRLCREIISRLKTLDSGEIDLVVHGSSQEQKYLLWIAVCRRYTFISEFAIEVVRERYISLQADLHYEDFDAFFNKKADLRDELDELRPASRNKLRQVLFKMLREADLLNANNNINGAQLNPRLLKSISRDACQAVLVFPTFDQT